MVVCKALFSKEGAPDYAELGLDIEPDTEWTEFAFWPSALEAINQSSRGANYTTIRFKSGDSFTTDLPFNEVLELCRASAPHPLK